MMTAKRNARVGCSLGIHLRSAGALAQAAQRFDCDVWIENDGTRANAKSIMSLLVLAAGEGANLQIVAMGDDAEEAVAALATIIEGAAPQT